MVYHCTLDCYDKSLLTQLTQADQQKALTFKSKHRQYTFILGRALLVYALSELGINNNYQLTYNSNGKPNLASSNQFFFNISHSGNDVFLGISRQPIGIDCEQLRERDFAAFTAFFPPLSKNNAAPLLI